MSPLTGFKYELSVFTTTELAPNLMRIDHYRLESFVGCVQNLLDRRRYTDEFGFPALPVDIMAGCSLIFETEPRPPSYSSQLNNADQSVKM